MGMIIAAGFMEPNSAVEQKIKDPRMTLRDNPLLTAEDTRSSAAQREIECKNRQRLYADVKARTGIHGDVYAGIMDMRY